jgi:phosphatidylinositol-3,4,5-trisphosphate 3-phosphatase/dual-specificity protein phosphatase PTEN
LSLAVLTFFRAGRSRTGTVISAYLLRALLQHSAITAIEAFNAARSSEGRNVVLPSQIRYVGYYQQVLEGRIDALQAPR